ncbi:MAG: flavodoxin [Eubacterium sp.]|nr:flavodoxin [Eubacterium sp.]
MRSIIVYYSLEGNSKYAAEKIAEKIGADVLELVPKKSYPTGNFSKFFWGGKSAVMAEKPALESYEFNGASYDRIIFGFPVWASNIAPPLRTFIAENDIKDKKIAAFACQSGGGAEKAFGKLKDCIGIDSLEAEVVLIDPKAKPSDDNEKKIADFCESLK